MRVLHHTGRKGPQKSAWRNRCKCQSGDRESAGHYYRRRWRRCLDCCSKKSRIRCRACEIRTAKAGIRNVAVVVVGCRRCAIECATDCPNAGCTFGIRLDAAGLDAACLGNAGPILARCAILQGRMESGTCRHRQYGFAGRDRHQRRLWPVVVFANRAWRPWHDASLFRIVSRHHHSGIARKMAGSTGQIADNRRHSSAGVTACNQCHRSPQRY